MIRAALAFILALLPATAIACPAPPHLADAFHSSSFTALEGCAGQGLASCRARGITAAWYEAPTTRYAHGVLGDAIEGGRLTVYTDRDPDSCGTRSVTLDAAHVFEDVAPRLFDLDGDGDMEVITVRSHASLGAQLAIWDDAGSNALRLVAQTPYIGRMNRWLAPVGAADLDGDGHVEIAYVDRPHLARTLRVWRFRDGRLTEIAAAAGLTNHRIGEPFISSGIRDCGAGPEMLTANTDWSRLVATRLAPDARLEARDLGPYSPAALHAALACTR